jgi:uncharacterized protein YecE (DUF72 family)
VFAAKVPQVVTHQKMLVDCETEFDEFIDPMSLLHEQLAPLLYDTGRMASRKRDGFIH